MSEVRPRNFVFLGEAGSGKSEIAINLALSLAEKQEKPIHFFDLDMTKPLFRSRDAAELLTSHGVVIHFEEQFMDAPTAAGGVRGLLRDPECCVVMGVGGDQIGARAVGGYAPLLNAPETAVCYVVNPYRPWSMDLEHIDKVLGETLGASHIRLDNLRIIGNPNLGADTTAEDVLAGAARLTELIAPYRPIACICVRTALFPAVKSRLGLPVRPIELYLTYPWLEGAEGGSLRAGGAFG